MSSYDPYNMNEDRRLVVQKPKINVPSFKSKRDEGKIGRPVRPEIPVERLVDPEIINLKVNLQ